MSHPLEAIIREAYAAFSRGDVDGYLQACNDDFEFHIPGHGGIAGTYIGGKAGIYALGEKAMTITAGRGRRYAQAGRYFFEGIQCLSGAAGLSTS